MQTFQLTPEKFQAAKDAVSKATGEVLPAGPEGNHGDITHGGVTVSYSYAPATQKLAVEITHKPFMVPASFIESQINSWFGAR